MIIPRSLVLLKCFALLGLLCNNAVVVVYAEEAARQHDESAEEDVPSYGVDISFPMHRQNVSINYAWLPHNLDPSLEVPREYGDMPVQPLGEMQAKHSAYLQGCLDFYAERGWKCQNIELERVQMNLRQPQSMRNYTKYGYTKIRAPEHVFRLLKEFWEKNKHRSTPEGWPVGNIYTNHWESPTDICSVENRHLEGGGYVLKQHIWNAARDTIQAWTGQQQAECSLYGIRVYKEGSMLATHVDRLPLVSSAIINVDQDVDEPWPLEVIGHDGYAHNITMVPGDLVLYESHSVLHGRPFPLKGRFMANVFIHFEPLGPLGGELEFDGEFPPYVIKGSREDVLWRRSNPGGHKLIGHQQSAPGSTDAHRYAMQNDIESLAKTLDKHPHLVNARDANNFTPLHEAVRAGDMEIVQLLLDRGADVQAKMGKDRGQQPQQQQLQGQQLPLFWGTPLWLAMTVHGYRHAIADLLRKRMSETMVGDEL